MRETEREGRGVGSWREKERKEKLKCERKRLREGEIREHELNSITTNQPTKQTNSGLKSDSEITAEGEKYYSSSTSIIEDDIHTPPVKTKQARQRDSANELHTQTHTHTHGHTVSSCAIGSVSQHQHGPRPPSALLTRLNRLLLSLMA